ncbi:Electron transfer flavoprotein domain-containing protein [Bacillus sp. OK048]|nr:Electron transfer flavoprotein domain-containing protein [Bacillus sp. OK048]
MIQYGADRVVKVEHSDLQVYTTDAYQQALLQVLDVEKPAGIVMGHTAQGKDVAPRIAVKLEAGLVSDAVNLEMDGEEAVFTVPIYAGKTFEKMKVKGLVLATIRPNNIEPLEKDESRSGDVPNVQVQIKATFLLQLVSQVPSSI